MASSKQIKLGAILSYLSIIFNMVSGLIYTPWMISQIGQSNYGLYTLATSVITMFVMDFGMSSAVSRFVSKYRAEDDTDGVNNFLGMVYKLYIAIDVIILIILTVVGLLMDKLYANLMPGELEIFKVLFVIVGIYSLVSFPFTNLNGILNSYEKFIQLKIIGFLHKVFAIVAVVLCLLLGYGIFALVIVNAVAGFLDIVLKIIVIKRKTPVKINLKFWNAKVLKEIFGFSLWTTISALAHRLIFNITPSIIVAVSITGVVGVSIFGVAQTVEGYVFTFATAINGMFLPRISRIINDRRKDEDLMPLMIKIGRVQCLVIGALVVGFICFGSSFIIDIWNKPDFSESYICAVLLIMPSFFYQPMQIANTTLVVENKVKLQAYVFIITGIVNVIVSVFLSKYFGAIGASFSIFIAYMIRSILFVIIYKKKIKLNMKEFFKQTYLKIMPLLLVCMAFGLLMEKCNPIVNKYIRFGINGTAFIVVFVFLARVMFMNNYEKDLFFGTVRKIFKKILLLNNKQ